ncbi:hypothetical protein ACJIZ3_003370 [Penstemon smallii]|uniref:Iron hydrogenase small subunit domain-containing protein n=1 Tax=Penstemon smallii TaxID=265156 RepID=A0ABD3UA99_9LAMI
MSEKFSAALRIGDLNDFIAPSQGCVVKAENVSRPRTAPKVVQTEPVKISLKDCLACSGCITSAETVMLEKQSLDEFLSNLNKGKTVIVSLSPQSRASLAVHFGLSPLQVFGKLTTLFKSLGVKALYDTSSSRDLTLIESCNEYIRRYKLCNTTDDEKSKSTLPMISSACPGLGMWCYMLHSDISTLIIAFSWICYAEKTLGSYILPYISSVKSPQQTIGAAIKSHNARNYVLEDIYHVTVMPCYDKKLEAARDDFVFQVDSDGESITEVDSVLTTGEVLDLIQLRSADFVTLEESPIDKVLSNVDEEGHLHGVRGSSGGYADTVFRYAAKVLFGKEIEGALEFKTIRNADFREVTLEVSVVQGKVVLRFALCYGFRNLRNVVTKIKNGKCEYHFLEIMACPSGCLNGGGQIKPKPGQSGKDLITLLETTYSDNVLVVDNPFENSRIKGLYEEWLGEPGSEKAKRHLHTEYHPVEKSISSQLTNW